MGGTIVQWLLFSLVLPAAIFSCVREVSKLHAHWIAALRAANLKAKRELEATNSEWRGKFRDAEHQHNKRVDRLHASYARELKKLKLESEATLEQETFRCRSSYSLIIDSHSKMRQIVEKEVPVLKDTIAQLEGSCSAHLRTISALKTEKDALVKESAEKESQIDEMRQALVRAGEHLVSNFRAIDRVNEDKAQFRRESVAIIAANRSLKIKLADVERAFRSQTYALNGSSLVRQENRELKRRLGYLEQQLAERRVVEREAGAEVRTFVDESIDRVVERSSDLLRAGLAALRSVAEVGEEPEPESPEANVQEPALGDEHEEGYLASEESAVEDWNEQLAAGVSSDEESVPATEAEEGQLESAAQPQSASSPSLNGSTVIGSDSSSWGSFGSAETLVGSDSGDSWLEELMEGPELEVESFRPFWR